jgi:dolichol-phosphate mannosyltransferase
LTILIPTYNEVANVDTLLNQLDVVCGDIEDLSATVVIIDDSSPDGTAEVVERLSRTLARENFAVRLLRKPTKEGLGAAYQYGFAHAVPDLDPDVVMQMDADLSHNPKYLVGFVQQARNGADLVNASRYIAGGGTPDWGPRRRFLSYGGNLYARLVLGRVITDYTGAFLLMSRELVDTVHVSTITATGYGFMLALKDRAARASRHPVEIPIIFLDREHGQSKLPKNTLWANFALVARMRATRRGA